MDYVVLQQRLSAAGDGDSPLRRTRRADPAVADRRARGPAGDSDRARRHGRRRRDPRDASQLRRCAHHHPSARGHHRRDARRRRHRRPDAQDRLASAPLGRRGRASAGDHVQHADRFGRAVPARDVAEGAAVLARPVVDGDRARDQESADDHQGVAARAASARCRRGLGARSGHGHRRRGRAAESDRERGARFLPADPVRAGARRPQRGLRAIGGGRAGVGAGSADPPRLWPTSCRR